MSGCGRKSQYRKHLTDAVLNDLPEPQENEGIAKVFATRGGNQFEIVFADSLESPRMAILPNKFHKLVWLKRNDYVIAETAGDEGEEGGIRNIIQHILYKEQIKHLRAKNLWPSEFEDLPNDDTDLPEPDAEAREENGIVYNNMGFEDDLVANTNRIDRLQIADESESESEDEN